MAKVLIVYYSMYGNVYRMAQQVAEGVEETGGASATIMTVPELMPDEVFEKNEKAKRAKELQKDVPIAKVSDLVEHDAIIVGTPTRFGNMCAQMRNLWDQTGKMWLEGGLVNKPGACFCSTGSLHGGQETTIVATHLTMLHHGMVIVGVPYTVKELLTTTQGGTPYGPSHTAGPDNEWELSEEETVICRELGRRVAWLTVKLSG